MRKRIFGALILALGEPMPAPILRASVRAILADRRSQVLAEPRKSERGTVTTVKLSLGGFIQTITDSAWGRTSSATSHPGWPPNWCAGPPQAFPDDPERAKDRAEKLEAHINAIPGKLFKLGFWVWLGLRLDRPAQVGSQKLEY